VRLVSREWRDCHDALVTRLTVSRRTTFEGMWLLVRRFPAVVRLEVKDEGRCMVTNDVLQAVSSLTGLTSLNLRNCYVDNKGLQALSSLTGLTSLDLHGCNGVTQAGVAALRRDTASSNLHILHRWY
jgi:hypothetical protein